MQKHWFRGMVVNEIEKLREELSESRAHNAALVAALARAEDKHNEQQRQINNLLGVLDNLTTNACRNANLMQDITAHMRARLK